MFGKYSEQLHELGWNIIPVHGKRPLITYWSQYSDIPPSKSEIREWCNRYALENIGLVLGGMSDIVAIDIDVDDEDRAKDLRTLAEQPFGESPIVRYGRHPRLVMLYRGMQIRTSVGPVEFLSTGRQVVIFGQHPLTKKAYYYEDFSPLQYEPLDLPLINQHDVTKYRSLVQQYLPITYKNGNGQPIGDTDFFDALKDARKATSAHERRLTICQQLQGGELGNLHNTLLSCIAALAKDNCSSERIKQIVEHNFNAPRTGPYSEDWRHMDQIIEKTVQKFGN